MNKIYLSFLILVCNLAGLEAQAQKGWQWGQYVVPRSETGPSAGLEAWPIAIDKTGNVYTAGLGAADSIYFGTILDKCAGRTGQLFISKTDSNGHYQWVLHPSATPMYMNTVVSMATDTAGDIYALCIYQGSGFTIGSATVARPPGTSGFPMYVLVKISPAGTVLWAKNIAPLCSSWLYTGYIGTDNAQNVYVAGVSSKDTVIIGSDMLRNYSGGYLNTFLAKYDQSGNPLWAKSLSGNKQVAVTDIAVTPGGTIYMTGSFSDTLKSGSWVLHDSVATADMSFLARFDSAGHTIWLKKNPNTKMHYVGVATDKNSDVYLTGDFTGPMSMGSIVFAGSDSVTGAIVAMADPLGNFVWARAGYGPSAAGMDIATDTCGKIVVTGKLDVFKAMKFDSDSLKVPAGSNDPAFAVVFDHAGNYLRGLTLPTGGDDWFWVALDNKGNMVVCGDYIVPPSVGATIISPLPPNILESVFFAKYNYDSVLCPEKTETQTVRSPVQDIVLFPDPASASFIIESNVPFPDDATAILYDIAGRNVGTFRLSGSKTEIPLTGFTKGMYLCRIFSNGRAVTVRKLAVQ